MATEIEQFQPRKVVREINKRLLRNQSLDEILKDIAPRFGIGHEALYQRLRYQGGRLMKQITFPEGK